MTKKGDDMNLYCEEDGEEMISNNNDKEIIIKN